TAASQSHRKDDMIKIFPPIDLDEWPEQSHRLVVEDLRLGEAPGVYEDRRQGGQAACLRSAKTGVIGCAGEVLICDCGCLAEKRLCTLGVAFHLDALTRVEQGFGELVAVSAIVWEIVGERLEQRHAARICIDGPGKTPQHPIDIRDLAED